MKSMLLCAAGMLRKVFISFASFAVRTPTEDLDGAKFSKLCKDAKLLGRNLSTIEVDIVFAKVKVCPHPMHMLLMPVFLVLPTTDSCAGRDLYAAGCRLAFAMFQFAVC